MKKSMLILCLVVIIAFSIYGCALPNNHLENDNNLSVASKTENHDEIIASDDPLCFETEAELIKAIASKHYDIDIKYYYKPRKITDDISLSFILVKDSYIALRYDYVSLDASPEDAEKYFLIEWYRTMREGDLSDNLSRTYPPDVVKKTGKYYIINAGKVQDVFWEQDGMVFHAVTPTDLSFEQLSVLCVAEKIELMD